MKVQRIILPGTHQYSWLVIGDDCLPIEPLQSFLLYLTNLDRSPHTVRAYAHHLKLFWSFLAENGRSWQEVDLSELARFVTWLRTPVREAVEKDRGRRTATVNSIVAAVVSFYDYQQRLQNAPVVPLFRWMPGLHRPYKGFLDHLNRDTGVFRNVLRLRSQRREPRILTEQQIATLTSHCDHLRDRFLVSLLYETGMRIGQALGLRHEDVRSYDREILIVPRTNSNGARAKSRSSYTVHVSRELMRLYADYLVYEYPEVVSDYVFVNCWGGERGRPLEYATVIDLFQRLSKKTGLTVRPHTLRHTHATELLVAGWDSAYVQRRLGHAQVQTTLAIYAHIADEQLRTAFDKHIESRKEKEHGSNGQ